MKQARRPGSPKPPAVLVIGSHFDDCEAGSVCGTVLQLVRRGFRAVLLNTSNLRGYKKTK